MAVPLLDLTRQYATIRDEVAAEVLAVMESQQFILGPAVESFEDAVCDAIGCNHAVGMSSGTDAQLAILMALGLGPGDAVLTTPFTFFATAGCLHRLGVEVCFVDIDPETFNLDPTDLRRMLDRLSRDGTGRAVTSRGNRIRAIIPIHLFGQCCEMDAIQSVADEFGLTLIEDAAQAMGAQYPSVDGPVEAGALAPYAYFSFFPAKNLGAFGDAGMATCRGDDAVASLRLMRNHGMEHRYYHRVVGGNFRLDALQAAVLHIKLRYLDEWNTMRQANADRYAALFAEAGLQERVKLPVRRFKGAVEHDHIFHQYVIRVSDRDQLADWLSDKGIGYGVYYPLPLHLQDCFSYLGHQAGDFPESERAASEVIALPIFPELREEEAFEVVDAIAGFYGRSGG